MSSGTPVTAEQRERIRELRYMDGLSGAEVARIVGVAERTVANHAPGRPGKVDNARLREAFERSGVSAYEVARRIGWYDRRYPDSQRVRRTLGLVAHRSNGGRSVRRWIDAETCALMAEAISVAPWEVMDE